MRSRRDEIIAAVDAYDAANPLTLLPRNAVRLLTAMFPTGDVCQRSLEDIAALGFRRHTLPATLERLVRSGFLLRRRGASRVPDTYQLYLPPVRR